MPASTARRLLTWAALAAALGFTLSSAAGAVASAPPSVRIVKLLPSVVVTGRHFKPRERVRLVLSAGEDVRARNTRTSVRGAFTVDFGTLADKDRCSGKISVVAFGRRGDRASYKLPPLACPTRSG